MTHLEWSALALASHVVLIYAAVLLICELPRLRHVYQVDGLRTRPLYFGAVAALAVLLVERAYYVVARLMIGEGWDLWKMHPAPEVLSGMVAVSIFIVYVLAIHAAFGRAVAKRRGVRSGSALALVWCAIGWVFW